MKKDECVFKSKKRRQIQRKLEMKLLSHFMEPRNIILLPMT